MARLLTGRYQNLAEVPARARMAARATPPQSHRLQELAPWLEESRISHPDVLNRESMAAARSRHCAASWLYRVSARLREFDVFRDVWP
eukprot:CAMPEP_0171902738 /NCGR_PEP_ID=MMETSP0993-20121228/2125_1 /TAXON_ID=483369 /ORGANISM="non described non described, Strain CCMP2098" /LENGTH=87 /DNA_ID=CAMNT_0012532473 /DNA_START=274 /DNA_END=537 /DNA_ORIENTATION=-